MGTIINDLSWKIGGAAGDGILSAGMMFAKVFLRGGLHVFATAEYPNLIRGGHNNLDVRIRKEPVFAVDKTIHMLVALNQDTVQRHWKRLGRDAALLYDDENAKLDTIKDISTAPIQKYMVPFAKISRKCGGILYKNSVALGACMALLDYDLEYLHEILAQTFSKKGTFILEANKEAASEGHAWIKDHYDIANYPRKLLIGTPSNRLLLTGNQAISLGTIKGGLHLLFAYPMTPASSIVSDLAKWGKPYNLLVKQTEDELAAINMAIGASYAGARSMVATSGGGFALMTEGLGLAGIAEIPVLIVEAQRPGPATGMATHTGQGDLRFVLHASPDEHPRIVAAPGDSEECYTLTVDLLNLMEQFQLPAILLTDKFLGESYFTIDKFDANAKAIRGGFIDNPRGDYLRFEHTSSGVSPRSIPGQPGGIHTASSYEHDTRGTENEDEQNRIDMANKRWKKLKSLQPHIPPPQIYGSADADLTFVSWGSTKGAILEAQKGLAAQGITTNFLQIIYMEPFNVDAIKAALAGANSTLLVEGNQTGLLGGLIRERCGIDLEHAYLKYDGRPFTAHDIMTRVKSLLTPSHTEKVAHD